MTSFQRSCRLFVLTSLLGSSSLSWAECDPQTGFDLSLRGETTDLDCAQRDYRAAAALGSQIRGLRQEQLALNRAEQDGDALQPDQLQRLRVIERELTQLEGLARVQGLLNGKP